jgi:hypothetical protein
MKITADLFEAYIKCSTKCGFSRKARWDWVMHMLIGILLKTILIVARELNDYRMTSIKDKSDTLGKR